MAAGRRGVRERGLEGGGAHGGRGVGRVGSQADEGVKLWQAEGEGSRGGGTRGRRKERDK